LVLTQRASGVINFAHAAIGTYLAFAFYQLRDSGDLVLPILGLPARVHVVDRPTVFTALVITLLLAVIVGLAIYECIFRWLRNAPALARVVASLGLFLYLEQMVSLRFGQGAAAFPISSILPTGGIHVLGVVVTRDRLIFAAIVAVVTGALWATFRWTRFGLATRAAAETEKGAVLIGIAPDRTAALNWILASILAGGAVIVFAPISGLDPVTASLLVVPALAAALVGSLESFAITAAAGLAIGMAQSALLHFATTAGSWPSWLPKEGTRGALPVLVILVTMAVRGKSLPTRETVQSVRLPPSPEPTHVVVPLVIFATICSVALLTFGSQYRLGMIVSMISAIICLSVVVVTGYVGQISLAAMAFAGVAGFTLAKVSGDHGLPMIVALPFAVSVSVLVGVLVGLPAVRIRGMSLAVATLAAAVAIENLFFASDAFAGLGGTPVPPPRLFGLDLGIAAKGTEFPRRAFGFFVLAALLGALWAVANLRRGPTGLRWLAVRANERAAAAAGIDVRAMKLLAFAISALLAGLGGTLLAYEHSPLSATSFTVFASLSLLSMTYLGGIAGISGALIAGVLANDGLLTKYLEHGGGTGSKYQLAASGAALVLVTILYPSGISGAVRSGWRRLRVRTRREEPVALS